MKNNGLFSAANKKYFASEIVSYIAAAAAASASAAATDLFTNSDFVITIISTIVGSIGFLVGGMGTYAILNISEYKNLNRNFQSDMKSMFVSNIHGIWVTYLFRIPFQYLLQKFGVLPAVAAPIAQVIAGQTGTAVRVYSNYKKKIFGHHNGKN
ncbi:MAG: hypothetical protein WCE45_10065 [Sedimentisphaerales bacterium]